MVMSGRLTELKYFLFAPLIIQVLIASSVSQIQRVSLPCLILDEARYAHSHGIVPRKHDIVLAPPHSTFPRFGHLLNFILLTIHNP